MAYLANQNGQNGRPEEENNQPVLGNGGGGVVQGSGGSMTSGAAKPPSASGSYTNLNQYLRANQGQSGALTGNVASSIIGKGQEAQQRLSGLGQQYTQEVESKTPTIDRALAQRAAQNASQFIQNPSDVQKFQQQRTAAYTGPQSLQDTGLYGTGQANIQTAKDYANLQDTESGRRELVGELYNPSRVKSTGMTALDSLLLARSPGSAQPLQQARETATGGLDTQLSQINEQSRLQSAQAAQNVRDAQAANEALFFGPQGVIPGMEQTLSQRADTERERALSNLTGAGSQIERLEQVFQNPYGAQAATSYQVSPGIPQWAAQLGLDEAGYQQLMGALQNYSTFDYGGVTPMGWYYKDAHGGIGLTSDLGAGVAAGTIAPIRPSSDIVDPLLNATRLDLSQYAQLADPEILRAAFTPESVATEQERANLAALEQLLGTDIGYYSGSASGPLPHTVGSFDLDTALANIREADRAANQAAYMQYILRGGWMP